MRLVALFCCAFIGWEIAGTGFAFAKSHYAFSKIADTTGQFAGFAVAPTINSSGTVAYSAYLDSGGGGLFTQGDSLTKIANGVYTQAPALNDAGTVAFSGVDADGAGIFAGNGGPITTIAHNKGEPFWRFAPSPAINAAGTVAFHAILDVGGVGVFAGDGGAISNVLGSGRPPAIGLDTPSINDFGTVAFVGLVGLFKASSGGIATITDLRGPLHAFGRPSLNNAGAVAFKARLDLGGPHGVFSISEGQIETIADARGLYLEFGDPALNDAGQVAFFAKLDNDVEGVFMGPDPLTDKVVATGDSLFGGSVRALKFYRGLNSRGEIAFSYVLDGGVGGIAVARPVPEPASLILFGLSVLVLKRRR